MKSFVKRRCCTAADITKKAGRFFRRNHGRDGFPPALEKDDREVFVHCRKDGLQWERSREMEIDAGRLFNYARADFQDAHLDGVELGSGILRSAQAFFLQGMQQYIGRAVKEQPKLVGLETMTGRAIRMQGTFMVLDEVFHLPPCTVKPVIDTLCLAPSDIGDDGPHVLSFVTHLGFENHAPASGPFSRLIATFRKKADFLLQNLRTFITLFPYYSQLIPIFSYAKNPLVCSMSIFSRMDSMASLNFAFMASSRLSSMTSWTPLAPSTTGTPTAISL